MADLGSIGNCLQPMIRFTIPDYRGSFYSEAVRQDGYFSGTVTVNGVAVEGCLVMCHWRPSGRCIARTWTARDGTYTIRGLDPASTNYYVVCLDPAGGTLFNDQIIAQATPAT